MTQEFNLKKERKALFERRRNIYDGKMSDFELEKEIEKQDDEFIKRLKDKFRKEFPLFYSNVKDNDFVHIRFREIINKLAGDKLKGELK